MKKKSNILLLLCITIIGCKAQTNELHDFIPKGYIEFEKHFGDLNKDGQDDCVLIIKNIDENNIVINLIVNLLRITLFKDHLKIAAKLWFYIKNKNNFELYFIPKSNPRD